MTATAEQIETLQNAYDAAMEKQTDLRQALDSLCGFRSSALNEQYKEACRATKAALIALDAARGHWLYNTDNFPVLVAHSGNWDIYRNESGHCAAIPAPGFAEKGCEASHMGDMIYLKSVRGLEYV